MNRAKCKFSVLLLKRKSRRIVREAMQSGVPHDDSDFLRLGWDLNPGDMDLPDWFEENRVQGHTRLPVHHKTRGFGTLAFTTAAAQFKELGARVYSRHVKTCSQSPWWPAATPVDSNGNRLWDGVIGHCKTGAELFSIPHESNVVQDMVKEARDQELHLITYYWHMTELNLNALPAYEEWICKDVDGTTDLKDPRDAPWLDISDLNYRDIVRDRLLELAKMGVDGFYFDHLHMPQPGCWCTALADAFEEKTDMPPPTDKKMSDPIYRQFIDFQAYQIEKTFSYWKQEVTKLYPSVVFVISATGMTVPHNRHETTNLVRLADSTKNEYKLALTLPQIKTFFRDNGLAVPKRDIRLAFGWVLLRDSADGRPPHIWERAFPNCDHALGASAALVTYGTVANINVDEQILEGRNPRSDMTPLEGLKAAFDLGNKVSTYLGHSRPLRWAAVHFSELARNRREDRLVDAWKEVLWPAMGAFGVLVRERLPVGIVNDYQLEHDQLDGYQVLYLPNPDELTTAQRSTIKQFVARGGILLKNNNGEAWSDPRTNARAVQNFRAELQPVIQCFTPPVRVLSSAKKMHAVAFENGSKKRLLVAVTNDFSFIQWVQKGKPIDVEDIHAPPPWVVDAVALVRNRKPPQQITEVLSGETLVAQSIPQGYKVRLPDFQTMALMVVQE